MMWVEKGIRKCMFIYLLCNNICVIGMVDILVYVYRYSFD